MSLTTGGESPPGEKIEADRARFRPFGPNAMAVRFLGVIGHQGFELGLGSLVVEKRRAGGAEEAGPTSSTRSCRRPEPPRREDAVVRCRKAEVSPRFGRSVSAHETAHRASAISLTANIRERGPIQ